MIYLDYSATTPTHKEVIESFVKVSQEFVGNANSLHKLGLESKKLMEASTIQMANLLKVPQADIIFTSGASEANNLALKGILAKYKNRGRHLITTKLEHSSVLETASYLEYLDFEVDYVNILENGLVDLEDLERLIKKETVLVSIALVNSEVGIKQDIKAISKILKKYKPIFFHVDATQAVGKVRLDLEDIDLISLSAHKFYGLKGIGCLIKRANIDLIPLIHGGKSQTNYRSGTPALPLIVSTSKALRISLEKIDENLKIVESLNSFLLDKLKKIDGLIINSNEYSIPHIINISLPSIKPETMLHALEKEDIFISTKTACSKDSGASLPLIAMKKDKAISNSSLRISLSHLTKKTDLIKFVQVLEEKIKELNFKKS